MAMMTLLVALTRDWIPPLFLGAESANAAATVELAAKLLLLGACFFIFDGIQTIGAGALRGLHDTRVPLIFAAIGFWIVGFSGAYAFGFPLGYGAEGIWFGLTLGLFVFASLLVWRFHRLTASGYLPVIAGHEDATPLDGTGAPLRSAAH
jgi:MATE family multidrug resistance protein